MITFSDYVQQLNEVLIQFGGKSQTQFGQVLILSGGASSGKGYVLDNLIGLQGKVFDVDNLKFMSLKSELISARVKEEFGTDLTKLDLTNTEHTSKVHEIIDAIGLSDRVQATVMKSIMSAAPDRKPNLIFDVTLKSISKLDSISKMVQTLGYNKENVHIVWVLNELDTALVQNSKRDRRVDDDILISTHRHVNYQMKDLISGITNIRQYMDGYFYIAFNKMFVDSVMSVSKKGGSYVKDAFYVKLKEKGQNITKLDELSDEVLNRIKDRVPDSSIWTTK